MAEDKTIEEETTTIDEDGISITKTVYTNGDVKTVKVVDNYVITKEFFKKNGLIGTSKFPVINERYPRGLTIKQIEDHIGRLFVDIRRHHFSVGSINRATSIIDLGLSELQSRAATKSNRISVGVSLVALFIALGGVGSSIYVANTQSDDFNNWQNEQISVLKQQVSTLKNINGRINILQNINQNLAVKHPPLDWLNKQTGLLESINKNLQAQGSREEE